MDLKSPQKSSEQVQPKQKLRSAEKDINLYKRTIQREQETIKYETIRKIQHLNTPTDNEDTMIPTSKKKVNIVSPFDDTPKKDSELQHSEDTKRAISPTPLKDKFAHLLPEHMCAQFNIQQRCLLKVQSKLDEHLQFLKTLRGRRKGDFFKNIRKNLHQSQTFFIELSQIKQILFLQNDFYLYLRDKDSQNCSDILIDLPPKANLLQRKDKFRRTLYQFVKSNGGFSQKKIQIPLFRFPFQEIQERLTKQHAPKTQAVQKQDIFRPRLNPFDIFSKDKDAFRQALYQSIQEKELKQKQESLKPKSDIIKFSKTQILNVIDKLQQIYMARTMSNIFEANLMEMLNKRLSYSTDIIREVLDKIVKIAPQFLKKVNHRKGSILQLNRRFYMQAREDFAKISEQNS